MSEPTTGEQEWVCGTCGASASHPDKRNPTTGEWTGITLSRLIREKGYQGVADAHNAAIAAERKKHRVKTTEYAKGWDDHVLAARSQIEDLQQQLAAARGKPV